MDQPALPPAPLANDLIIHAEQPPQVVLQTEAAPPSSLAAALPEVFTGEFSTAQSVPSTDDRFLQPPAPILPAPVLPPPGNLQEPIAPPAAEEPAPVDPASTERFTVQQVEVWGSTVLKSADIEPLTKPLNGRTVTLTELQALADRVTQIYLDRGYLTSRAVLDPSGLAEGKVLLRVIEGSVERIDVVGTQRLNPAYVRSRIELGAGTPLNAARLEDQLRLLRADPLFQNVEASLRPGSTVGKSVLSVRVTESRAFEGNTFIDNYSPPSVGSEQFGVNLGYRNLTGIGDQVLGSYSRTTTGGAETIGLAYRVPLNPMDGTLQLRANWTNSRITQEPFDVLDIRGDSELYELSFRQPLSRSPREEFALSLGFSFQDGQTFVFNDLPTPFGIGPDANGVSRTSVIKFGQDYVRRDPGGAWSLRSQFSIGTGLFDATENPGSAIPDGQFFSWLGQVQRVQRLSENHLLIAQADVQLTPDSLLPSQQFVIGGGQSVRGYRQNARSGDNGVRISVEDRITVQRNASGLPILQLAPFAELGAVWNRSDNPNLLPRQNFLASLGLGLLWQPVPNLNVRLDYGVPLVSLRDRGNNVQDHGFHFSVSYQF